MDGFINETAENRQLLCEHAQATLGLAPASIEKDFWVCWTLRELFSHPDYGAHLTFKGGTSLSKAWKLINRFSEDIDIVVDREFLGFGGETLNSKQQKKLIKKCSEWVNNELKPALDSKFRSVLPAALNWSLEPASATEDSDQQTLLFNYPSAFGGNVGYVRQTVKIEMGARSDIVPHEATAIQSYLAQALPNIFGSSTFNVRTVLARRTFWEKAMLLHEETFRPAGKKRKARLSRHYYDLWSLITKGVATQAVADAELFDRVARHRKIFFRISWVDYTTLHRGSLRLVPPDDAAIEWRQDYKAMSTEMFFGEVPDFEEIMRVVGDFERNFNQGV